MRLNVILMATSMFVAAHAAATPVSCSTAETATAKKAAKDAQAALTAAAAAIQAGEKAAINRLGIWLGVNNSGQAEAIRTRLLTVATWLGKTTFQCENQTISLGDVFAYVTPGQELMITLSVFFFSAPDDGQYSSKLGVLVHEASHFALSGAAKDPKIYGPEEAQQLAKTSPAQAQGNAENIEYFVESYAFKL